MTSYCIYCLDNNKVTVNFFIQLTDQHEETLLFTRLYLHVHVQIASPSCKPEPEDEACLIAPHEEAFLEEDAWEEGFAVLRDEVVCFTVTLFLGSGRSGASRQHK
jgi:hypothetical protein